MTENQFIYNFFGVKGVEFVSKATLMKALHALAKKHDSLVAMLNYVSTELYCENPKHLSFAGRSTESLEPLAKIRAERIAKAARPRGKK